LGQPEWASRYTEAQQLEVGLWERWEHKIICCMKLRDTTKGKWARPKRKNPYLGERESNRDDLKQVMSLNLPPL